MFNIITENKCNTGYENSVQLAHPDSQRSEIILIEVYLWHTDWI
jgi:hypothetical protein